MRVVSSALVAALVVFLAVPVYTEQRGKKDDVVGEAASLINYKGEIRLVQPSDFPEYRGVASKAAFRIVTRDGEGAEVVDPVMYVVGTAWQYQRSRDGFPGAIEILAAVLEHELTHGREIQPGMRGTELDALNAQRVVLEKFARGAKGEKREILRGQLEEVDRLIQQEKINPTRHETREVVAVQQQRQR